MSTVFRELLKKVGSGTHTSEHLTRQEAADATRMMLLGEATPAQIGAFLISHRIKRPTGEELAGMLDAYHELGQKLQAIDSSRPVMVFGCPYDGRSRTAPVTPLTALILATAGQPAVTHGGDRMPTKYGVPLVELWAGLDVDWSGRSIADVQAIFANTGLGFVYLPEHFPEAFSLVAYRDQIGKRPPLATLELIWCPYDGPSHIVAGFVHPPTEQMFRDALTLQGQNLFTTVKGLEGSCDLARERAAIVGYSHPEARTEHSVGDRSSAEPVPFDRLVLHARDCGFSSDNVPLNSIEEWVEQMQAVLQGKKSDLMDSTLWNGGFYLWHSGICPDLETGIAKTESLLTSGQVAEKLHELRKAVQARSLVHSSQ